MIADEFPSETMASAGPSPRRVAAIDCGTNSIRLLIADVSPARSELADVVRRMEIVRLGQGVDATGRLAPEALARTLGVLKQYASEIRDAGAAATRMVATSATRDASNAADFTTGVVGTLSRRSVTRVQRMGCISAIFEPHSTKASVCSMSS